ncbi:hypothetical protein D0859_12375 [Hortaea werneckii]|uniref:Uncharacterized protein n=1 Tax=Hortaea werneckii TaxID=91943 RepID=A0A3M7ID97_HORWE|nr:hypothetical protein D0859_12375 [Hortaea werneckii]
MVGDAASSSQLDKRVSMLHSSPEKGHESFQACTALQLFLLSCPYFSPSSPLHSTFPLANHHGIQTIRPR